MYTLSVVSTNTVVSEMSVDSYYATDIDDCVVKMNDILDDAIRSGRYELMNSGRMFAWLRDVTFTNRVFFLQIAACHKA